MVAAHPCIASAKVNLSAPKGPLTVCQVMPLVVEATESLHAGTARVCRMFASHSPPHAHPIVGESIRRCENAPVPRNCVCHVDPPSVVATMKGLQSPVEQLKSPRAQPSSALGKDIATNVGFCGWEFDSVVTGGVVVKTVGLGVDGL